jgi:hypothetical protein
MFCKAVKVQTSWNAQVSCAVDCLAAATFGCPVSLLQISSNEQAGLPQPEKQRNISRLRGIVDEPQMI